MSIAYPRILYLYSTPLVAPDCKPLDLLDVKAEQDAIVHELSTCKKKILLRIGCATLDELARNVPEGFNILVVSSHGYEESILFEDGRGGSQPVTGKFLRKFFSMGSSFRLAVVTACRSEKVAALLVKAGIQHVVAVRWDVPVLDHAAIVFVGQFFRSLFQGDSVQKAFEMATLLVEANPELAKMKSRLQYAAYRERESFVREEEKFVLLPKGSSVHQDALIERVLPGTLTIEEPLPSQTNLPVKPQSFIGRSKEMYEIINELYEHRFTTVTGAGGIGKTTLAIEVARWFSSRAHFPDGVYYIDLRETDTTEAIVDALGAALRVQSTRLEDITANLENCHCLLLLDNAEDMLWKNEKAMQGLVNNILKFTADTTFLITSQRPVGGNLYEPERVYRVCPLHNDDAALLFFMTARRRMTREEWDSNVLYQLLQELGGHPLSIVLTARQLGPGVTCEDLVERIAAYKAKAINVKGIDGENTEHGESLVAALASAYHSLSDAARTGFSILSLLPAGAERKMLAHILKEKSWECVQELNEASLVEVRDQCK